MNIVRGPSSRHGRYLPFNYVLNALFYLQFTLLTGVVSGKKDDDDCLPEDCTRECIPVKCLSSWWTCAQAAKLATAAVLIFFATFLPRVLVRLVIFVFTKLPFVRETAEEFRTFCSESTAYFISVSLVCGALRIAQFNKFLCHFPWYTWGVFFLIWLYSLFNVVESIAVRRFAGPHGDFSKRMVISESVKILRLTVLLIIALIIYRSALGDSPTLRYSVLAVIGLAIGLGFVPSFHNVIGGLFLAFNAQFKIDDFIQIGDADGFVHRVTLRYTTVVTTDGTTLYVPNSFFLYKPMINFTQRPKRDIDLRVRVASTTPVDKLRDCLHKLEHMLQSLHVGLTSHEENASDVRHNEKWDRFFFVAMEELFVIRVYSYTDELDSRKFSLIQSEVWLAMMEILEEMDVQVVVDQSATNNAAPMPPSDDTQSPLTAVIDSITGTSNDTQRTYL